MPCDGVCFFVVKGGPKTGRRTGLAQMRRLGPPAARSAPCRPLAAARHSVDENPPKTAHPSISRPTPPGPRWGRGRVVTRTARVAAQKNKQHPRPRRHAQQARKPYPPSRLRLHARSARRKAPPNTPRTPTAPHSRPPNAGIPPRRTPPRAAPPPPNTPAYPTRHG